MLFLDIGKMQRRRNVRWTVLRSAAAAFALPSPSHAQEAVEEEALILVCDATSAESVVIFPGIVPTPNLDTDVHQVPDVGVGMTEGITIDATTAVTLTDVTIGVTDTK